MNVRKKMTKRSYLLLVVCLVGLGTAFVWKRGAPPAMGVAPHLSFVWEVGKEYRYQIKFSANHMLSIPAQDQNSPQRMTSKTTLDADIVIAALSQDGEETLLSWRLENIRHADIEFMGQSTLLPASVSALLQGHDVLYRSSPRGDLSKLYIDPQAPDVFAKLAQHVISETQVHLPKTSKRSWTQLETSHTGLATSAYAIRSHAAETTLLKTRSPYKNIRALPWMRNHENLRQQLDFAATIAFKNGGPIQEIQATEEFAAFGTSNTKMASHRTTVHTQLVDTARIPTIRAAPTDLVASRRELGLHEMKTSPSLQRKALLQRVAGFTWENLVEFLHNQDLEPGSAAYHRQVWRAIGLLKLDPKLASRFVTLLEKEKLSDEKKQLVFSILAAAGHPTAQSVMVDILESEKKRTSPTAYRRLVQRFSFVEQPTPESAYFIENEYLTNRGNERIAAGYALGSIARHARASGNATLAKALNAQLVQGLQATRTAGEAANLLGALSNAGHPENLSVIEEFAQHDHPRVRAASARALVHMQTEEATNLLVALSGDNNARVQRAALQTLGRYTLDSATHDQVAHQILDGNLSPSSYLTALRNVRRMQNLPLRKQTLAYMLQNSPFDNNVRGLIKAELHRMTEAN